VYVSFVLRPKEKPAALPVYTLAAGVAAVQAIADVASVAVGLKWVNDLVYDGSKIGGILAELASDVTGSDNGSALVIGIGINVEFNESELPPELIGKMNWLANISGKEVDRNQLVARLAHHLEKLSFVLADDGAAEICRLWRTHAAMLGQKLKVIAGKETFEALACDIDDSGALIVEKANGEKSKLYAGEVSIRGIDGNYI
jgi:BirA family biotin operon repressor/biotin-[acetyl-CoA-carboxylase] ligase